MVWRTEFRSTLVLVGSSSSGDRVVAITSDATGHLVDIGSGGVVDMIEGVVTISRGKKSVISKLTLEGGSVVNLGSSGSSGSADINVSGLSPLQPTLPLAYRVKVAVSGSHLCYRFGSGSSSWVCVQDLSLSID